MEQYEAYMDESGTNDGELVLSVSGYVINSVRARQLETRWRVMLEKYNLPFFHMVECVHRNKNFFASH
jgi:hypothetical protein